ncbi:MAG: trigger factor [Francisellaceae bacterium]|nr:trigger factor [Francisellaceae bacterium]
MQASQVSIENTSSLGRKLIITVPAEKVQIALNNAMKQFAKNLFVPGFQKGKVNPKIVEKKFNTSTDRSQAINKILESNLLEILKEKDLKPAGRPLVEEIKYETGEDLSFTVLIEIFPEINLSDISQLTVEKLTVSITDTDVENATEKLSEQFADWVTVDRPANMGDRIKMDYFSTIDGKSYENNSGKDVLVELGAKHFIEGFEEGLLGAKKGDKVEMDLQFPFDWRIESIRGKQSHFVVDVKEVSVKNKAQLDQDFAKKIGANGDTEEDIKQMVRKNLEKQVQELIKIKAREDLLKKVLAANPIDLPQSLIEREMQDMHDEMHQNEKHVNHHDCQHQGLEEEAKRRVALGLLLSEVIKKENLTLNKDKVKEKIAEIGQAFGNSDFVESMYYESEHLLQNIQNSVFMDQAVDHLLQKAQTIENACSFDELVQK